MYYISYVYVDTFSLEKGGKRNLVMGNQIHFVFQLYQEKSSDMNLCEGLFILRHIIFDKKKI